MKQGQQSIGQKRGKDQVGVKGADVTCVFAGMKYREIRKTEARKKSCGYTACYTTWGSGCDREQASEPPNKRCAESACVIEQVILDTTLKT